MPFHVTRAMPLAALGLALLTAACTTSEGKGFACNAAATIDGWFGQTPSAGRAEDCGAKGAAANTRGAQVSAARSDGRSGAGDAPGQQRLDRRTVADVQQRLLDLGYDPGPSDGRMGPKTRSAIRAYQKDSGLSADGRITASLIDKIRSDSRN